MNEENKQNFDVSPEEDIPNSVLGGNEQEKPNCEAGALCFFPEDERACKSKTHRMLYKWGTSCRCILIYMALNRNFTLS